MHFCLTAQYTLNLSTVSWTIPHQSLRGGKNLIEAAGGKLISMYSTLPMAGVLVIFDVPDGAAPAISGVV